MSENPWVVFLKSTQSFILSVPFQLVQFVGHHDPNNNQKQHRPLLLSVVSKPSPPPTDTSSTQEQTSSLHPISSSSSKAKPLTKEELGRATWTLLHTLAAQYPENPTRQQKRDVKELMAILSRLYPCRDCADHFKDILKANPVQAGSHVEFSQWLCHVHNVVNRSLGKVIFPCQRVDARWGKLECKDRACDLEGSTPNFG